MTTIYRESSKPISNCYLHKKEETDSGIDYSIKPLEPIEITEEMIGEVIYPELLRVFEMGLKQSPFDGENSEFYRPMIDLTITPKLAKAILNLITGQKEQR